MPGSISDSYSGPPICKCGHFKPIHNFEESYEGSCEADGCLCLMFEPVLLDDTELGKTMNQFIGG